MIWTEIIGQVGETIYCHTYQNTSTPKKPFVIRVTTRNRKNVDRISLTEEEMQEAKRFIGDLNITRFMFAPEYTIDRGHLYSITPEKVKQCYFKQGNLVETLGSLSPLSLQDLALMNDLFLRLAYQVPGLECDLEMCLEKFYPTICENSGVEKIVSFGRISPAINMER